MKGVLDLISATNAENWLQEGCKVYDPSLTGSANILQGDAEFLDYKTASFVAKAGSAILVLQDQVIGLEEAVNNAHDRISDYEDQVDDLKAQLEAEKTACEGWAERYAELETDLELEKKLRREAEDAAEDLTVDVCKEQEMRLKAETDLDRLDNENAELLMKISLLEEAKIVDWTKNVIVDTNSFGSW